MWLSVWWLISLLVGCGCAHPRQHPKSSFRADRLKVEWNDDVRITVNITSFEIQKQPVLVSWRGVQDPDVQDMIALYVPANATLWHRLPVHFASCAALNAQHMKDGSGTARFELLNMRGSFRFVLLRGGVVSPVAVAQSDPIWNNIARQPTGGHLALHADSRSVVVQWISASRMPQQLQWVDSKGPGSAAIDLFVHDDKAHDQDSGTSSPDADSAHQASDQHLGGSSSSSLEQVGRWWRFTASSAVSTYNRTDMCGYPANGPGWLDPGFIHTAIIPGATIIPGERYFYRFGQNGVGWSSEASFIAPVGPGMQALTRRRQASCRDPPLPTSELTDTNLGRNQQQQQQGLQSGDRMMPAGRQGTGSWSDDDEQPFVFLAFNDVCMSSPLLFNNPGGLHFADDYGENSTLLSARLASETDAHMALMVGDLAYAMGYGADWDVFGDQFESVFRQWPLAVGTGNHERDWPGTGDAFGNTARDSGGECNVPFMHRWYTPANVKGDPGTAYYAFSQGPVHFLVLDSESPSDPESPQGRYVAADLASVNREVTPWVVVAMHRMMVAPATWRRKWVGDVDNMERLQSDYEELFKQYQVDVVIQGHEHAYARSCPMYKGVCTAEGLDAAVRDGSVYWSWLVAGWQQVKAWLGYHATRQARAAPAASSSQSAASMTCGSQYERGPTTTANGPFKYSGKHKTSHTFKAPAGGPVYVLAGHAGAGFTWGFPSCLPAWLELGAQGVNGYLRFQATSTSLHMDAIVASNGTTMDFLHLIK